MGNKMKLEVSMSLRFSLTFSINAIILYEHVQDSCHFRNLRWSDVLWERYSQCTCCPSGCVETVFSLSMKWSQVWYLDSIGLLHNNKTSHFPPVLNALLKWQISLRWVQTRKVVLLRSLFCWEVVEETAAGNLRKWGILKVWAHLCLVQSLILYCWGDANMSKTVNFLVPLFARFTTWLFIVSLE